VRTRDYFDDDENIENFSPDKEDYGGGFRNDYSSFKDEDILGDNDLGRPSNFDELAQIDDQNRIQFDEDDISSSDGEGDKRGSISSKHS